MNKEIERIKNELKNLSEEIGKLKSDSNIALRNWTNEEIKRLNRKLF